MSRGTTSLAARSSHAAARFTRHTTIWRTAPQHNGRATGELIQQLRLASLAARGTGFRRCAAPAPTIPARCRWRPAAYSSRSALFIVRGSFSCRSRPARRTRRRLALECSARLTAASRRPPGISSVILVRGGAARSRCPGRVPTQAGVRGTPSEAGRPQWDHTPRSGQAKGGRGGRCGRRPPRRGFQPPARHSSLRQAPALATSASVTGWVCPSLCIAMSKNFLAPVRSRPGLRRKTPMSSPTL